MSETPEVHSVVQDCTIDLRGAGYHCVDRDDDVCTGVYGEGDLALCEGPKVTAIGLHILGPKALAEKIDAAVLAERERCAVVAIRRKGDNTAGLDHPYDKGYSYACDAIADQIRKGPTP